jgi:hypothetical protein
MNTVISNIRVPENKYQMWKAMAAEGGLSLNEFLIRGMDRVFKEEQFGKTKRVKLSQLKEIAKMANKPMGWSQEDEAIYG